FGRAIESALYELRMNVLTYANKELVPASIRRAEELLRSSARCMGEVQEAMREAQQQVLKLHDEEREAVQKAAEDRRVSSDGVEEAFGKLAQAGLFGGGQVKEAAVEANLVHQQAVLQVAYHELTDEVLEALEAGLEDCLVRHQRMEEELYRG